ncbi:MAG: hypothetical protein ACI8TQ_001992 [Planctomycetota bacterium]|jgi:hypothetical protein
MESKTVSEEFEQLSPLMRRAFAPLKKRALGFATGLTFGGLLFFVTAYHIVFQPGVPENLTSMPFGKDPVGHLRLLGQYFTGYEPDTLGGAGIGACWLIGLGFILGFVVAALRNLVVRIFLFSVRARGNLDANKGFLDQI